MTPKSTFLGSHHMKFTTVIKTTDYSLDLRNSDNASSTMDINPTDSDFRSLNVTRNRIRRNAKKATDHCDERNMKNGRNKSSLSLYNIDEHILLRYKDDRHKVPKKYQVIHGINYR